MTTPLHAKIMMVLEEAARLSKHEAATRMEEFILSQTNLRTLPHYLDLNDLSLIRQSAIRNLVELNASTFRVEGRLVAKDEEMARTVCFLDAITGVLWNLGLLTAPIKFK